jgi:protein-S-isoprenylcysteine O-methyltransferase Ste14
VIPVILGILANIPADRDLKNAHTTVKPFENSSVLLTAGVFRLSRNPMYLGMVLILIGEAWIFGSLSPFVVVILFAVLMQFLFIVTEEKMLEARFGNEYKQYKQKVRQWI